MRGLRGMWQKFCCKVRQPPSGSGWVKYVKPSAVNAVDVAAQEFVAAAMQENLTMQSSIEKIRSVWEGEYLYYLHILCMLFCCN